MPATSQSLLERIRTHQDPEAWQRWLAIYEPWLRAWLSRHQLQHADADDVLQNILAVVGQQLPAFVHSGRPGAFRTWLRTILVNQVRYFLRSRRLRDSLLAPGPDWVDSLEDPASELSRQWDLEHDRHLVRRLLASVQPDFHPRTWEAFRLLVLEDRPAAEVAQACGMDLGAVYVAKSRVLARLRQELRGMID